MIGKNLDLPGIIKTYSLERYYNSYALILEDFGGISLYSYLTSIGEASQQAAETSGLPIPLFLSIAVQVAHTLDGLCRHRVIHKDLKPANIVINPIRWTWYTVTLLSSLSQFITSIKACRLYCQKLLAN
ncbi:protein kinase [Microcoleus sp. FACHB-68]|uniref:protein kinase domain-containing protein n=1 Tax=Microcoleus sp. FACHB-68 TaxID=2692826 RepID=UPI0032205C3B